VIDGYSISFEADNTKAEKDVATFLQLCREIVARNVELLVISAQYDSPGFTVAQYILR
jgi:hypothetical protein